MGAAVTTVDLSGFEMLEVPDLEPALLPVKGWRTAKGDRVQRGNTERSKVRRRLCWEAAAAADLAGVPVRTVYEWARTGFVEPTFTLPERGIIDPQYCAFDVFNLRLARDLLECGVPRPVVLACCDHFTQIFGYYDDRPGSFGELMKLWGRWFVPVDRATAGLLQREYLGVLVLVGDDGDDEVELREHPDLTLAEYPIGRRAGELDERAAAWWRKAGEQRPPWA